jgi:transaldolase/glucose-6-phosphate isomerase
MPPSTLEAFRDHGHPRASLEQDIEAANNAMETLERLGISMKEITDDLLRDGVGLFADAFDKLLNAVDKKCRFAPGAKIDQQVYSLPDDITSQVKATLEDWQVSGKVRRLWARDASLWTGSDERNWLGWLGITEDQLAHSQHLTSIAEEAKRIFTRAPSWYGWVEPLSGGAEKELRQD